MNRRVAFGALAALLSVPCASFALTSSRDTRTAPAAARSVLSKDPIAYRNEHAWVEKARAARLAREAQAVRGPLALSAPLAAGQAVTGTLNVPVLLGYTGASQPVSPFTQSELQTQYFGSNPSGSVSAYYSQVSYGQFTVAGTVGPWTHLNMSHLYYAGPSGQQGLVPGESNTDELIEELLIANDPAINFAQYDNDGPDGLPNSGDDDGFVDLLCVVHSQQGGECGLVNNIASHAWRYSAWPEGGFAPYVTNDAKNGGGFILVDDYNITPVRSCASVNQVIEIGVLCHELGHGLGLPDLYGVNPATGVPTGDKGAGDWSLMGTGNWNTPSSPAHFDPWCKKELGWLVPTVVGWEPVVASIPAVETNPTVYQLPFTDERFRRSSSCTIAGSYSLYCGLTEAEGIARGWAEPGVGGGYGSNWRQTVEREFTYNGSGAVNFQFTCTFDLESGYDFAYALIEVNGVETVLLPHTGNGGGSANVSLTSALAPLAGAGGDYTLKFRVISDSSFDDADGQNDTDCGAFVVDNVSVTGGGEAYTTGFETNAAGWHQDPAENAASEYWLVENRRRTGFDAGLHEPGLLIWHVDDEVMRADFQINNGVLSDVRGLVVEEADGEFDLNKGINSNTGEAEDVFPGPLGNTSFTSATTPNSDDNTGRTTQISVTAIGAPGPTMSATLRAGDPAPTAASVTPAVIDNDQTAVVVDIAGTRIRHGATFQFQMPGAHAGSQTLRNGDDIVATSLEWIDATILRGTINVYSKTGGAWDLVVTNPDGQTVTLQDAITINQIVATQLVTASVDVAGDGVRLRYELLGREESEILRLRRSTQADGGWVVIEGDLQPVHGNVYEYVDASVEAGRTYHYLLESVVDGVSRELHRAVATLPARELVLEQNHPNPFNPTTSIRFYLPERGSVTLEIFDVRGALVRRLARGEFDAGPHSIDWDGSDEKGQPVASGMYVYRLQSERRSLAKKMVLLK